VRRSQGNDGHSYTVNNNLPLRQRLVNSVLKSLGPEPKKQFEPRAFSGPRPFKTGHIAKHADEVILEVRRLYEQEGMHPKQIQERLLQLGRDIDLAWIKSCTKYVQRSYLVPAENSQPYLKAAS
jgi:hypothetical protein